MCDDLSSLKPSDDGTKPTAVWKKSLPTNEFFSILLDEAHKRLGHKISEKIEDFHCYFDKDDVISESMLRILRRLRRPIDGVAELSADGSTMYFNDFKRVFGYLKKRTIERTIIDMIRKRTKDKKKRQGDNDTTNEIVAPVPTVVRQIKQQTPDRFVSLIKDDLDISHQRVMHLRLDGQPDHSVASSLGISHMKARRCREKVEDCFRSKFTSPRDLLDAMCPESLFNQN